jgi:hypothetical protein
MYNKKVAAIALTAVFATVIGTAGAAGDPFAPTRANLAKSATFTVTQTTAPKGSARVVNVYHVEVKGDKARVDFSDPAMGAERYLVSEKYLFIYTAGNNAAMKQELKGGVEMALQTAFASLSGSMKKAKRVGSAIVSGQPTDIYRDTATNAVVYLGKNAGFRLPVKAEETNVGGMTSLLVTDIRLNPVLPDTDFALPKGAQVVDTTSSAGTGVPGRSR